MWEKEYYAFWISQKKDYREFFCSFFGLQTNLKKEKELILELGKEITLIWYFSESLDKMVLLRSNLLVHSANKQNIKDDENAHIHKTEWHGFEKKVIQIEFLLGKGVWDNSALSSLEILKNR